MKRMYFKDSLYSLPGVEVLVEDISSTHYRAYFLSGKKVSGDYLKIAFSPGWPVLKKTPLCRYVLAPKEPETYIALWGSGSSFCDGEVMSKELIEDYLNDVPNLKPLNIRECYLKGLVKVARITFIEPTKKTIKKEVLCVD